MVDDPRLDLLRHALAGRPARAAPREAGSREAAVALVLRPRDQMELLLVKRAERQSDPWSGHMALPGGRRDPADADLLATAFRETTEETSVPLSRIGRLLGALDEVAPASRRLPLMVIAPFLVAVPPDTLAHPDPREIEAAIWVPLAALREEEAASEILIELEGGQRRAFPSFQYGNYVIWGLTHRILQQFLEVAAACGL